MSDVYLVHESADGGRQVLATEVETADSLLAQTRGLMFRDSVPEDYALVFRFEPGPLERVGERLPAPLDALGALARRRSIHMLFVRVPLDVLWLRDSTVVENRTLRPWRGHGVAPADTVVELAAGGADGVEPGDSVGLYDSLDGVVRTSRQTGWRGRHRGQHGSRTGTGECEAPRRRSRAGRGRRRE